ncbi:PEP-CTERM protein-sorting domain-containing protein/MYXO-CTERM domain-containing protein [Methylomagnum ishizawai]|uniref:PEP-CTERM protein-sorting domain-containing protein/MYXO-CTERM domain-containing protein n=1 Tax=Methylomagnum ishizawai TaxID=1760988 RepID=A0A1Y6D3B8_9GAMM|nr:PEP-CTERM sorting domain-containing protein [Methylomagnum ishizawai]SMF97096.1 PEP-CTERM protein-sorting domain-containing protein/MYXO-CTERM domain-containing protein [Methylomagnum ishizawai]
MPQPTPSIPSTRYGDKIALAAGSLALLPTGAAAGVIYFNTPISSPAPTESTPVFWDVDSANGNGNEFGLSFSTGCGCLRSGLVIFSSGLNGSGFVAQTGPGNPFGIANLPLGFKVGNSSVLASGYAGGFGYTFHFVTSSGNLGTAPQGFSADVPGYFGFSFTDGIDYFYGWAEMTISLSSQEFTISQWAYNDTPYAAICVGETSGPGGTSCAVPEPGSLSLALLGMGAGGLRAWRRRKQAMPLAA